MPNSDGLMTAVEVAQLLRVNPETVRRWAREGRISAITLPGGHFRYRRADVDALLTPSTPEVA